MYRFRKKLILQYLILTFLLLAVIIFLITSNSRPHSAQTFLPLNPGYQLILDAGHGGLDGGAVAEDGTAEAAINLAVTLKTQSLMKFFGIDAMLTRTDENSLDFDPTASIKANKNADLHARLAIAQANPQLPFLSIHLNKFEQEKYYGAQVFYSPNSEKSQVLSKCLQDSMRSVLDPSNDRRSKIAPNTVMLMQKIPAPAVTIECGFLSNRKEAALLQQDAYQSKIAISILHGYINYVKG